MTNQTYLTEDGKVRVRLIGERFARYPQGEVLDADGNVVGEATSYTYGGAAFAVHTLPFASHVKFSECEFIGAAPSGYKARPDMISRELACSGGCYER